MPLIRPLRALRYGSNLRMDLPRLLAPPDGAPHPCAVRALIHGERGPLAGPDEPPFTHAARALRSWKEEGVLVRDARPSLYVLEHEAAGVPRRGLVALVRLDDGVVRPHEAVRGPSTEALLSLLRATKTAFSLVMMIVPDDGSLRDALTTSFDPDVEVADGDGVINRLWQAQDPGLHRDWIELLRDRPAVIADGHHRWEAARRLRAEAGAAARERPEDYALALLVPSTDPGLRCGATHRVLAAGAPRLDRLAGFGQEPLPDPSALDGFLQGPGIRLGLVLPGRVVGLTCASVPGAGPAARTLDAAAAAWLLAPEQDAISASDRSGSDFAHNRADAATLAGQAWRGELAMALIMRPVPPQAVLDVALAGELMPPKSTNFLPKPSKGLLMASLASF